MYFGKCKSCSNPATGSRYGTDKYCDTCRSAAERAKDKRNQEEINAAIKSVAAAYGCSIAAAEIIINKVYSNF